MKCKQINLAID